MSAAGLDQVNMAEVLERMCGDGQALGRLTEVLLARALVLDAVCDLEGRGLLVLASDGTELFRTQHTARLAEKWFSSPGAPEEEPLAKLRAHLAALPEPTAPSGGPARVHTIERAGETLVIEILEEERRLRLARFELRLVSLREQAPLAVPQGWHPMLTRRQVEIASLLIEGFGNESIALRLGCSLTTVKKQVSAIFGRLGVFSRAQLCALAARRR